MISYYIGIEDLAANALIENMKRYPENRFLSYKMIEEYGCRVKKLLHEKGYHVELVLSKENTLNLLHNFPDFFEEKIQLNQYGLLLKANKDRSDLIKNFRGYLAYDLLQAFLEVETNESTY